MPTNTDCITAIKEASPGITDKEAREILNDVVAEKKRLSSDKTISNADQALGKWGMDQGKQAQINAALQRKHAALNIIKGTELDARLSKFYVATKNRKESFLSLLVGSQKRAPEARNSAYAEAIGHVDSWIGGISKELNQRPQIQPMLMKDQAFIDDVIREMHENKKNGKPGITKNDDARFTAEIISRYAEDSRVRLNDAGAFIGKLEGWSPQNHDAAKLLKTTVGQWVDRIHPVLDAVRTFDTVVDVVEQKKILAESYENIVTGRDHSITGAEKGEFLGPRNLAKSMGKHREFHFINADEQIRYEKEFGKSNFLENIMEHFNRSGRKLALMEKFGPNPEQMLISKIEKARREIRESPILTPVQKKKEMDSLDGNVSTRTGKIGRAFEIVNGELGIPEPGWKADAGQAARGVIAMARYGGAVLSSINDLMTFASNARHMGMNLFEAYGKSIASVFEGKGTKERQNLAYRLGVLYDGMMHTAVQRWNAQDTAVGKTSRMLDTFFKWSGMNYWTSALKNGYARMVSSDIANQSHMNWNSIDPNLKAVFGYHGINEKHWEVYRSIVEINQTDGRKYLIPDSIKNASYATLDQFNDTKIQSMKTAYKVGLSRNPAVNASRQAKFDERLDKLRIETRRDLENKLMTFYSDESSYAVIEPDARTRMVMTQNLRPGTWGGELIRFVMQAKSFPIAYMQRILGGRRFQKPTSRFDVGGIAHLIAGSLVLGYAAMTMKDITKGRQPKDPAKWETWLAAAAQSGGAGIYGDFVLSQYSRFGRGFIETMAGPGLSTAGQSVEMASGALRGEVRAGDAVKLAQDNMPYINLWYTRAALDYAILFHVREMLSPGTLARSENKMKEEYNQKFILPPSSVIRRGGGFR